MQETLHRRLLPERQKGSFDGGLTWSHASGRVPAEQGRAVTVAESGGCLAALWLLPQFVLRLARNEDPPGRVFRLAVLYNPSHLFVSWGFCTAPHGGTRSTPLEFAVSRCCGGPGSGWSLSSRVPGPPPACLPELPFPLVSGSSCLSFASWDASVWNSLRPLFPVKTSSQQRIWTFIESRIYVTIAENNY